ncbi:MAG TPA: Asp23/Gls24 family envelope stress response protein [Firmicutes bacterium]|nr:Asp23/Gls24 family envelope stress response protein [Bacillota bacterium]
MSINQKTPYGGIDISMEAIASVAGKAASECYGVVGLASKNSLRDNISELLRVEDYVQGVYAKKTKKGYQVDVYLYLAYGVKLNEILSEVQKKVKYVLEKTFEIKFESVNVFVQDIKEIQ